MTQIEDAILAHRSVRRDLRNTEIVRRSAPHRILHPVNPAVAEEVRHYVEDRFPGGLISELADYVERHRATIRELRAQLPPSPRPKHSWWDGRDHETLMAMVAVGEIPIGAGYEEWNSPQHPPSLRMALEMAKERGYTVPTKFTDIEHGSSFSERNAWWAAQAIVRGPARCLRGAATHAKALGVMHLAGSHVVPDPVTPGRVPYVLDQLWIVAAPDRRQVRLLALEIDGEPHLDPEQAERDRRRDIALAAMGYETYRVAGWWARIDPFRVVLEFLRAADVMPGRVTITGEPLLRSIDDYVCGICDEPMVRDDDDWISEVAYEGDDIAAHGECVLELAERDPEQLGRSSREEAGLLRVVLTTRGDQHHDEDEDDPDD